VRPGVEPNLRGRLARGPSIDEHVVTRSGAVHLHRGDLLLDRLQRRLEPVRHLGLVRALVQAAAVPGGGSDEPIEVLEAPSDAAVDHEVRAQAVGLLERLHRRDVALLVEQILAPAEGRRRLLRLGFAVCQRGHHGHRRQQREHPHHVRSFTY